MYFRFSARSMSRLIAFSSFCLFFRLVLRWVSVLVLVCICKYTSIFYMLVDSHSAYTYVSKACQITTLNTAMHRNTEYTTHNNSQSSWVLFFLAKKTNNNIVDGRFCAIYCAPPFYRRWIQCIYNNHKLVGKRTTTMKIKEFAKTECKRGAGRLEVVFLIMLS